MAGKGQIGIIQTADNVTIVSNLIRLHDWLREKSIIKFGKKLIEEFSPPIRDIIQNNDDAFR